MKLWKDNKSNQEYEIPEKEIIDKFLKSDFYKEELPLGIRLMRFIVDKNGLNSVFETKDFHKLLDELLKSDTI